MCMCGWMDCILAEKIATPTLTQPKPLSSPVQVTQPSSTQDSFAMSNGPALRFSLFVSFSATLSRAGPPLSSLPPRSKDGRWWLGCQRPRRWMGNSIRNFGLEGCLTLNATPFEISGPLGTMLQIQWFCCRCCHFYIVARDIGFSVLL